MSVDEVSDSEPERVAEQMRLRGGIRARKYAIQRGIEDIAPSSAASRSGPNTPNPKLVPEQGTPLDAQGNLSNPTSRLQSPQSSVASSRSSSPPNLPKHATRPLNIKQFAYSRQLKEPSIVRAHSTSAALAPSVRPSAVPHKKKTDGKASAPRKRGPATLQNIDITDEQWARLRSCVCCDASWTARKSVKGKRDHLRTCAKTHFASDELVQRLVLKQLESCKASTQNTVPLLSDVDAAPNTLLDDVIEANRSPRTRRIKSHYLASKEGSSTALSPNVRSDLKKPTPEPEGKLARAEEPTEPFLCQASDLGDDSIAFPPATQMPPPSRFAKVAKGRSILSEYFGGASDRPASMSSTQQLPPSRFSSTLIPSRETPLAALRSGDMPGSSTSFTPQVAPNMPSLFSTQKSNSASFLTTTPRSGIISVSSSPATIISLSSSATCSPSASTAIPCPKKRRERKNPSSDADEVAKTMKAVAALKLSSGSPSHRRTSNVQDMLLASSSQEVQTPAVGIDPGDTDWGNDGVLEWGGVNDQLARETDSLPSNSSASSDADSNTSARELKVARNTEQTKDTTLHHKSVILKSLPKSKSKGGGYIPLNDPMIDAIFIQMILNDEPLYLRVLRYEPIHFNIFLEKALACNVNPRGLANRLRTFLDSQCIHFQAITAPGGQMRVTGSRTHRRR